MKNKFLLLSLLGSLTALGTSSCILDEKEEARPQTTVGVRYQQTQCADPWGQARTPQDLEVAVKAHLQQQGIVAQDVHAQRTSGGAVCLACVCKTGIVLEAQVSPADLQAVLAMGFQEI